MNIDDTRLVAHARRLMTAAVCAGALVAVCGGAAMATVPPGDSAPAGSAAAETADSSAPAEPAAVAVTLTDTSIDGLPDDLVAGLVDVTVTDETEGAGGEINFVMVEPGTDVETFKTDLIESVFTGGPIPDYWLNLAGAVRHSMMITLDEGEYIVLIDLAVNLNRPSTVNDIVTAPLTVGAGDNDAVIPTTDGGRILAGDYLFDADLTGGGSTVAFTNTSDNQFHHVVVWDFGTNDPAVVEENLPAIVESDGQGPPPEGIDMEQVIPFIAYSPVFGPGSSGTFDFAFEEGHTYAVMCYIQDRDGGLPHVLQHGMYDVFHFGAA